eukprot:gene5249-8860_t
MSKTEKHHKLLLHFSESHKLQKQLKQFEDNFEKYKGATSLSNYVSKLFSEKDISLDPTNSNYIKNGLINWTLFIKENHKDLTQGSIFIRKIFKSSFMDFSTNEFENYYKYVLKTDYEKIFQLYIQHQKSKIDSYQTFLNLSTIFEKYLGSVFSMKCDNKKPIPSILRDILESKEINDVFGENVVFFISTIIGPPEGLNLRNILWHGFLSFNEFDPDFTSFLFILFISTVKLSKEYFQKEIQPIKLISLKLKELKTEKSLFTNKIDFMKNFDEALKSSYFIIPDSQDVILQAFEEFFNNKLINSLTLILPQFEHCLRRIFVLIHDEFPQEMLMAQSRVLFTTLDIILSLVLENGNLNKMIKFLGENIVSALNDIFVHYDGARIRDKIAHGDLLEVDENIVKSVLQLFVYMVLNYNLMEFEFGPFQNCFKFYEKYQTIFHPKSKLLQQNFEVLQKWKIFNSKKIGIEGIKEMELFCQWNKKGYSLGKLKDEKNLDVKEIEQMIQKIQVEKGIYFNWANEDIDDYIDFYLKMSDKNTIELYPKAQSENRKSWLLMIGMLRKISEELSSILVNIIIKADYLRSIIDDRTARSSHRKVFASYVQTKQSFSLIVKLIASMIENEINQCSVDNEKYNFKQKHKEMSKIYSMTQRINSAIIEGNFGLGITHFLKEFKFV